MSRSTAIFLMDTSNREKWQSFLEPYMVYRAHRIFGLTSFRRPLKGLVHAKKLKLIKHALDALVIQVHDARFMQNPSPIHAQQADRAICYLRDTKDLSIQYCGYA